MDSLKEFTGKERMLVDWMSVRNAMLRADSGEMKVSYKRNEFSKGIFGVTIEVELGFNEALSQEFTEDEKSAIDAAKKN